MQFIIFITIFTSVMTILTLLIARRFVRKLHFSNKTKIYMYIFLSLNLLGVFTYMYVRYTPSVPNWLYFLLCLPIGIIFLLFIATIIYEISSRIVNKLPVNESRRNFFKKSLDIGAVTVAGTINAKAMYNAKTVELEQVEVSIKNLKKSYSIVQLSDIHIGGLIDQQFISNIVKRVNALKPDIVVITGDLVDVSLEYAKPALNELKYLDAKLGSYFVIGNHEYFHGARSIMEYLNFLGIKALENENVYIGNKKEGFYLAGVYDVLGYQANYMVPDIDKALQGAQDGPTVLLAHQPRFIEEVKNVDLMLSGHTHGGQIMPFNFIVKWVQPYIKGLHQHNAQTQIYVNKGTGFWGPPMRLGASAEITYLTLKGIDD